MFVTGDISICYFVFYNLSRDILSVNFLKGFLYLLIRVSLLMAQFSDLSTADFSLALSCSTSSQSYLCRYSYTIEYEEFIYFF